MDVLFIFQMVPWLIFYGAAQAIAKTEAIMK